MIRLLLRFGVLIGAVITSISAWNQNTLYAGIGFAIVAAGLILDQLWGVVRSAIRVAVLGVIAMLILVAITRGGASLQL